MLRVAIGERDGVPLLMQPGGQVNGKCRFADTAFGICDHDNHGPDHTPLAGWLASNMCIIPPGQQESQRASWQESTQAWWQASALAGKMASPHLGMNARRHDGRKTGQRSSKPTAQQRSTSAGWQRSTLADHRASLTSGQRASRLACLLVRASHWMHLPRLS